MEAKRFQHWWNLDTHLAEVISKELRNFAEKTNAYPGGSTPEEWNAKLTSIAERLEQYNNRFETTTVEAEQRFTEQGQQALREFAEIFPSLWD